MIRNLRVPLRGTGRLNDPYRPPLPSCVVLRTINADVLDSPNPQGIVAIDDALLPDPIAGEVFTIVNVAGIGDVITAMPASYRQRIKTMYDTRYRERVGEFDPNAS
jgi:hypothetical protein